MNLTGEDQGKEGIEYLDIFHFLCYQIPCPIQQQARIFPSLPFATDLPVKALLFALHIPCQIQHHMGFGFSDPILLCMETVSTFLPRRLALLLAFACFLFTSLYLLTFTMLGIHNYNKGICGLKPAQALFVFFKVHFGFAGFILGVGLSHIYIFPFPV